MAFEVVKLGKIGYQAAWDLQKDCIEQISSGHMNNRVIVAEHPHTITLGRNSSWGNLLCTRKRLEVLGIELVETDRGGDITYHGPGQLIIYPLFSCGLGPKEYLRFLERILIKSLLKFGILANAKAGYTGVWVKDNKIASIGVKFNRRRQGYITSHGVALNVNTNLDFFNYIIPCGIKNCGVTSMQKELHVQQSFTSIAGEILEQLKSFGDVVKV
ncbi:MAG: hypothetical protein RLZ12_559 [Bacillota bacterium]|jgi:lipoyl(octanoyl) transferase